MVTSIDADVSGSSMTVETPDRETGRMWIRTYRVDANGQPTGDQDSCGRVLAGEPGPAGERLLAAVRLSAAPRGLEPPASAPAVLTPGEARTL